MLDKLLQADRVICAGTGGVGKTTFSALLACYAALQGKRVLVLTVDPSKRLAQNLGIEGEHLYPVPIVHPRLNGYLDGLIIQSKLVFDEFVRKCAGNQDVTDRLMANNLYHQLSTTLAGSQEFTSLEAFYSAYETKKYDFIVLDTPPSKHAIDFLEAPQKIHSLFQAKVTQWFRKKQRVGIIGKLLSVGSARLLDTLKYLTGADFMDQLSAFFEAVDTLQAKISERAKSVEQLLHSPQTHFVLISSFDEAKLKEGLEFHAMLKSKGFFLKAVVANRSAPQWYFDCKEKDKDSNSKVFKNLFGYFENQEQLFDSFVQQTQLPLSFKMPQADSAISTLDEILDYIDFLETKK